MISFSDFLNEDDASGGMTAPSNNVSGSNIAGREVPFMTKEYGKLKGIVIPHTDYLKIKENLMSEEWVGEGVDPLVKAALNKAIDGEDKLLVTSDKTKATAIVRHKILQRIKQADDITQSA